MLPACLRRVTFLRRQESHQRIGLRGARAPAREACPFAVPGRSYACQNRLASCRPRHTLAPSLTLPPAALGRAALKNPPSRIAGGANKDLGALMVISTLHVAGADHRGFGVLHLKAGGLLFVIFHGKTSFWGVFPEDSAPYIFLFFLPNMW